MKRTGRHNLKLKLRLKLVRATVRELTPRQLQQVDGGNLTAACITQCCLEVSKA